MSDWKMICESCGSMTDSIGHAAHAGLPCPWCGKPLPYMEAPSYGKEWAPGEAEQVVREWLFREEVDELLRGRERFTGSGLFDAIGPRGSAALNALRAAAQDATREGEQ